MKGMWIEGLKSQDIIIQFVPPALFELYQTQKLTQGKLDTFNSLKEIFSSDEFNSYVAKKVMKLTDEEIDEYYKKVEEDKIRNAIINYKVSKAEDSGNPDGGDDDEDF